MAMGTLPTHPQPHPHTTMHREGQRRRARTARGGGWYPEMGSHATVAAVWSERIPSPSAGMESFCRVWAPP